MVCQTKSMRRNGNGNRSSNHESSGDDFEAERVGESAGVNGADNRGENVGVGDGADNRGENVGVGGADNRNLDLAAAIQVALAPVMATLDQLRARLPVDGPAPRMEPVGVAAGNGMPSVGVDHAGVGAGNGMPVAGGTHA